MTDEQIEHLIVNTLGVLAVVIGATNTVVVLLVAVGAWYPTVVTELGGWLLDAIAGAAAAAWLHLARAQDGSP